MLLGWGVHLEEGGGGGVWQLAHAAGCDFNRVNMRRFARREVLSFSSAVLDHFELRLAGPSYIPFKLADPGLGPARKLALA